MNINTDERAKVHFEMSTNTKRPKNYLEINF